MSKLLLRLKNVPEDESNEIRSILSSSNIEYYETYAGAFGIGMAGIWLQDESDFEAAKVLLEDYSIKRLSQAKLEQRHAIENNENETFLKKIAREPFKILLCIIAIGFMLYISIIPFVKMAY